MQTRLSTYAPGSFVNTVRRELDDAFNQAFGNGNGHSRPLFHLPVTIWEDDGHVYLEADVPGFDRESLELVFRDGQLWIRGERKLPRDDGKYRHNERMFGRFERAITMPDSIEPDTIDADLECGVLHVTLHKNPEAQPMKVAIKSGGAGSKKRLTKSDDK